ncbi:UNVERIFIED_CONTAM: hypothetical protein GTU68_000816 [Idotea baltica]|nr:hypothetical protein [Idotea baltica]
MVWLQGELSNFSRPASGHFYFSLKDSQAQIRCAMFRGKNRYVDFDPKAGDEVLVRGKLGLYAARGDFQLIVEHMEPAGTGKLLLQFEQTKKKLHALGWFDVEAKKPIPDMPQRIGVITSATGAAIRDVLQVLARRCPQAQIIIYPTLVQGATAAPKIVEAIQAAERRSEVDVLLLVRGGGSMEDLWAFNEEPVAKAIYECEIPIVCGVGHEVDVTIADHVADLRAPTPSAAAELSTPDGEIMVQRVAAAQNALSRIVRNNVTQAQANLHSLNERLKSPSQQLLTLQTSLASIKMRLDASMQIQLGNAKNQWQLAARALDTVSPLATLERGFAVVKHKDKLVTDAAKLASGDQISTQVAHGTIHSKVESVDTRT